MESPDPTKCGANVNGRPCRNGAGKGTDHYGVGRCKLHGGASPQAQVTGVVTLARREAAVMGIPLEIRPHEAILECVRIAAGEVAYCSQRIQELDSAVGTKTVMAPPDLHIWVKARHAAMDRLVTYSATALKAGVDERQVRVAEQAGEALVALMRGVLARLGLQDDPKALEAVRAELLTIDSTARDVAA